MFKMILLMTRGIIADPRTRRWGMFILLLTAMLMAFFGWTFLPSPSTAPLEYILYWVVCAWLTLGALLLALLDILVLRIAARRERRRLEEEMRRKHDEQS